MVETLIQFSVGSNHSLYHQKCVAFFVWHEKNVSDVGNMRKNVLLCRNSIRTRNPI
jgi:hypothetical protein